MQSMNVYMFIPVIIYFFFSFSHWTLCKYYVKSITWIERRFVILPTNCSNEPTLVDF